MLLCVFDSGWLSQAANPTPAPPALIAQWHFDEGTGNVAGDSAGNYPGTLSPTGCRFITTGVAGGALELSRDNNGFVDLGQVLPLTNTAFTVTTWVRTPPGDSTPLSAIISKHQPGYGNGWYMLINEPGANGRAVAYVGDSAPDYPISASLVNDGQWHHVAMVYDPSTTLSIYVDGAPAEDIANAIPARPSPARTLIGGLDPGTPSGRFNGQLDELQIYSGALSSDEIDQLYRTYTPPLTGNEVALSAQPAAGTYTNAVTITLSATPAGDTIRYTLDTTEPSSVSPVYGSALSISTTTTLRAAAFRQETRVSPILLAHYDLLYSPAITSQPVGQTLTVGDELLLSVSATGTLPLQYRWTKDDLLLPDQFDATLRVPSVHLGDQGAYRVIVSNAAGTTTSAPAAIVVNNPPNSPLLAHWRFDNVGSTLANDETGEHHGALSRTGSDIVPSDLSGGALRLAAKDNGFVDLGPTLDLTNGSFSVSVWTRTIPQDNSPLMAIVAKHRPGFDNGWYLLVNDPSAAGRATGYVGSSRERLPASATLVNDGRWHHVVMVYEANQALRIYVDGTPREDQVPPPNPSASPARALIGGLDSSQPGGTFTGWVDELKIFGYPLSESEIGSLYQDFASAAANSQPPSLTILPSESTQPDSVVVRIARSNPLGEIRYTLNGQEPTASSLLYESEFTLTQPTTIHAKVFLDGLPFGPTVEKWYEVLESPRIIGQPSSVTASPDDRVTFAVSATGSAPLHYQWLKNSQPIPNATSQSLTIDTVSSTDAAVYTCLVSNRVGSVLSSPATLVIQESTPLPDSLIARWRFDEVGSGVASEDSTRYPGSLSPTGATLISDGVEGGALLVDRKENGFVNVGNVLPLLNQSFSISTWMRMRRGDITPLSLLVSKHRRGYGNGWYMLVNDPGSRVGGAMAYVGDSAPDYPVSETLVNDGNWHHVVMVYRNNQSLSIYVDGTPSEDQAVAVPTHASSARVVIGGIDDGIPTGKFSGWIDDLRIYGIALSNAEVDTLYHSYNIPPPVAPETVEIFPNGGTYASRVSVQLSTHALDGEIRYTLDGTTPNTNSTRYVSQPLEIAASTTLIAGVFKGGVLQGELSSATFVITSPAGGFFTRVTSSPVTTDVGEAITGAWADYDRDGDLDLFVTHVRGLRNALYRNDGAGTFTRVTDVTPVTQTGEYGGAAWGDYNNDGWVDLFATDFYRGTWVYPNIGNGLFGVPTLLTATDGAVAAMAGSWADYDGDGLLDLFVAYGGGLNNANDQLYHQVPGGGFQAVTQGPLVSNPGYSMGAGWADYDGDLRPDLYVANGWVDKDLFYHNDGSGSFSLVQSQPFASESGASGAVAWGDYDNDGDLDLFVGFGGNERSALYRNDGPAGFTAITDTELTARPSLGVGAMWGDFDNDGWLDLYQSNRDQPNSLYRNRGDGTFTRITEGPAVTDVKASNGSAWGDYDGDGFLDLFVANWDGQSSDLYHNVGNANHWLKVRLVGTKSNKSGIGAKVRVKATLGGRTFWQMREINTGDGLGAPELIAHFGLGNATVVEVIRVEWPSGTVDQLESKAANQVITVEESAAPLDRPILVTPAGGTFTTPITLTFSGGSAGASLRYAFQGVMPTASSPLYTGPFPLSTDATLTVAAFINGTRVGEAVSYSFHFELPQPAIKPTITGQPVSLSVLRGETASFAVTATGTAPLEYRWYFGTNQLPVLSAPTLTLASVTVQQAGLYKVVVANEAGSVTSSVARLSVTIPPPPQPPHIVSQSHDQTVDAGDSVTLSVEATGPQLSYAWHLNNAAINGATSASLSLPSITTEQGGTYYVIVSNPDGSVTSEPIIVTVHPVIPPSGGTVLFSNRIAGILDAPVYDIDGTTLLDGVGFTAQFYAGPSADALQAWGTAVPFRSGVAAGYWVATTQTIRYVGSVPPGQTAWVQARAWDASAGSTYEEALANGGKTGTSQLMQLVTGGAGIPPSLPTVMTGLQSFSLRPTAPPEITTAPASVTLALGQPLRLEVVATGKFLAYQWLRDGEDLTGATAAKFEIPAVTSAQAGRYRVRVTNPGGSVVSAEAQVTVTVERSLRLVGGEPTPEGARVVLPVRLSSKGEVGGGTLVVRYDTNALADPQVTWSPLLEDAFTQVNTSTPGEVRLVFALAAAGITPGEQDLAALDFRARSVAGDSNTEVGLEALDLSDATGTPLRAGTEVLGTEVAVRHHQLVGDSNGNLRLDVGDATIILQFLGLLDTPRPWDVTGNDVNASGSLDSGDVIRVLRSVVGLDLPPGPSSPTEVGGRRSGIALQSAAGLGRSLSLSDAASSAPATGAVTLASVSLEPTTANAGTRVRVSIRLDAGDQALSGASFTLRYSPEALRLTDTRSLSLGGLVPNSALAIWNVVPGNNFAAQEGVVRFGASTAKPWPSGQGVLAELLFEVQPGASFRHRWPLTLEAIEVTRDGYDSESGAKAEAAFIGREAQPPSITAAGRTPGSQSWSFTLAGEPEVQYRLETSDDLVTWVPMSIVTTSATGALSFADPAGTGAGVVSRTHRFYRAVQLP